MLVRLSCISLLLLLLLLFYYHFQSICLTIFYICLTVVHACVGDGDVSSSKGKISFVYLLLVNSIEISYMILIAGAESNSM